MCADNSHTLYVVELTDVEFLKLIATHYSKLREYEIKHILNIIRDDNIYDEVKIADWISQYDNISFQVGNTMFHAGTGEYDSESESSLDGMIYYYMKDGVDDTVIHDMQQAINGITTTKPKYI